MKSDLLKGVPVRSEIKIIPADLPKNRSIGFMTHENVGVAVFNPNCLTKLQIRTDVAFFVRTIPNLGVDITVYLRDEKAIVKIQKQRDSGFGTNGFGMVDIGEMREGKFVSKSLSMSHNITSAEMLAQTIALSLATDVRILPEVEARDPFWAEFERDAWDAFLIASVMHS